MTCVSEPGDHVLPLLVLVGPTAAGKTQVALRLAARLGAAEIISADSRQVYRYMDIGTAKPTATERRQVLHRLVDIRDPDEVYSAGAFAADAETAIADARTAGHIPIIVGGSGMYVEALLDGLTPLAPAASAQVRRLVEQKLRDGGADALYAELVERDPQRARRIHQSDLQRLMRALEQLDLGVVATRDSTRDARSRCASSPVCWICISRARELLYKRIDQRADVMLAAGLLDEIRHLLSMGYDEACPGLQTLGYAEALDGLRGRIDRATVAERIKRRTRRYAKRQLTWFRRDRRLRWIDVEKVGTAGAVARILRQFERIMPGRQTRFFC